jgi:hypothetical protein
LPEPGAPNKTIRMIFREIDPYPERLATLPAPP